MLKDEEIATKRKGAIIFMLKIIKNNTNIKHLRKYKYVLYSDAYGFPTYAKIGIRPIIGHIIAKIKFKKVGS